MTENIFIGIFRLKGHQGMGKTCACFKFKEKVWLWDTLVYMWLARLTRIKFAF